MSQQTITVSELRDALGSLPGDARVYMTSAGDDWARSICAIGQRGDVIHLQESVNENPGDIRWLARPTHRERTSVELGVLSDELGRLVSAARPMDDMRTCDRCGVSGPKGSKMYVTFTNGCGVVVCQDREACATRRHEAARVEEEE